MQTLLLSFFFLFLPVQLGYHFWPDWAYVNGIRVDYLSPTLFLIDLIFMVVVIVWVVERRGSKNKWLVVGGWWSGGWWLVFGGLIALNIIFSESWQVSIYKWLVFFKLAVFAFYIYKNWKIIRRIIYWPILASMVWSITLGIGQMVNQGSFGGLVYLVGERMHNVDTIGITKTVLYGKEILRPYGSFGHPNVFGAYGLFCGVLLLKIAKNNRQRWMGFGVGVAMAVVSFSQNALMGIGAVLLMWILVEKRIDKVYKYFLIGVLTISLVALIIFGIGGVGLEGRKEIVERIQLIKVAYDSVVNNIFFGVGLGNFVYNRMLQPVHNIIILLLQELGVVFFVLVLVWFNKLINAIGEKGAVALYLFFVILVTGMVDHYWITSLPMQYLLALAIGVGAYYAKDRSL